jgi:hypothetical protein
MATDHVGASSAGRSTHPHDFHDAGRTLSGRSCPAGTRTRPAADPHVVRPAGESEVDAS